MRDIPSTPVSDEGFGKPDPKPIDNTASSNGTPSYHDHHQVDSEHDTSNQPHYHLTCQQFIPVHHGMSQPPPGPHAGPYNMAPMANALPSAFQPGQHPPNNQQRYNSANSPPMVQQLGQFVRQGYYMQQPHMAQYYGGQMSQASNIQPMVPRQNMQYYPNHMMMGHPQSTYFYPLQHQYSPSAHPSANHIMGGPDVNGHSGMNGTYNASQPAEVDAIRTTPSKDVQGRHLK